MATYSVQLNPVTMAFEVVDETNTVIESFQSLYCLRMHMSRRWMTSTNPSLNCMVLQFHSCQIFNYVRNPNLNRVITSRFGNPII